MFDLYELKMEFEEKLCGSVPLSGDLIGKWLEARAPNEKTGEGKSLDEIEKEVRDTTSYYKQEVFGEDLPEDEKAVALGFQMVDGEFVLRAGTVKAHIKDCALQLSRSKTVKVVAFRSKIANWLHVEPYWLHILGPDGKTPITKPGGAFTQPVHTMTRSGPINALKLIYYVENPVVKARVKMLRNPEIGLGELEAIFEYGGIHGYGGERGMGEGRYQYALLPAQQ